MLATVLGLRDAELQAFLAAAGRQQGPDGRSNGAVPPALPVPLQPLIGRDQLLAHIVALLVQDRARLLTLTGVGGVGKTRLALAVAQAVLTAYQDGVIVVELAAIHDPAQVLPLLMHRLGLDAPAPAAPLARLISFLHDRRMLLVLDNMEHLIDAAAQLVSVLEGCPDLAVLVTSRLRLGVRGERELAVEPLALPLPDAAPDPAGIKEVAAVRLFIERAQAQTPSFRLTRQNAGAVAAICRRLDGLPLAIELAAARMRLFTAPQLQARLERRLPLLMGGARDLPDRHQTMRTTIAWSYQLLHAAEQALFQRLAIFAGGATVEAVQAVCGTDDSGVEADLVLWLEALLDHHLIGRSEVENAVRLTMLDTVREYAWEQLVAAGNEREIAGRHAAYYLALAERRATPGSPEEMAMHAHLEIEHGNLRAALAWCLANPQAAPPHAALRFTVALDPFWRTRGYVSEGRIWLAQALAQGEAAPAALQARACVAAGFMGWLQGDLESATALALAGLDLARQSGEPEVCARAHNGLGAIENSKGNVAAAREHCEQALAIYRTSGAPAQVASQLNNLGNIIMRTSDVAQAIPPLEECISLSERVGHRRVLAFALGNLGAVTGQLGDSARAQDLLQRALALFKQQEDLQNSATVLWSLGRMAYQQGDLAAARALLTESATSFDQLGSKEDTILALELLAAVFTAQGQARTAALLLGAAAAGRAVTGAQRPDAEQPTYAAGYAATVAALEPHVFAAAWATGQVTSLPNAVQAALAATV
jgi:predicted ATPase/Tfp pilus assembly protein PilF